MLGAVSPRQRPPVNKGAVSLHCKTETTVAWRGGPVGHVRERSLPVPDSNGEKPLGLRNGATLRGVAIGTKASAGGADVYQHANGPPSRLARTVSDRRGSKEAIEEGPRGASLVGSDSLARERRFAFAQLLRPARIPCPAGPPERCRPRGRRLTGLRGPGLEPGCRGIRVARGGVRAQPIFASKEDGEGSVKSASYTATFAGPTPAAGEDSARGHVLVRRI